MGFTPLDLMIGHTSNHLTIRKWPGELNIRMKARGYGLKRYVVHNQIHKPLLIRDMFIVSH